MLEVKYKEEKNPSEKSTDEAPEKNAEEFELPKNVKQVGEVEKERKLYIEDYVITYLQQLTKNTEGTKTAVFLGEKKGTERLPLSFYQRNPGDRGRRIWRRTEKKDGRRTEKVFS